MGVGPMPPESVRIPFAHGTLWAANLDAITKCNLPDDCDLVVNLTTRATPGGHRVRA